MHAIQFRSLEPSKGGVLINTGSGSELEPSDFDLKPTDLRELEDGFCLVITNSMK